MVFIMICMSIFSFFNISQLSTILQNDQKTLQNLEEIYNLHSDFLEITIKFGKLINSDSTDYKAVISPLEKTIKELQEHRKLIGGSITPEEDKIFEQLIRNGRIFLVATKTFQNEVRIDLSTDTSHQIELLVKKSQDRISELFSQLLKIIKIKEKTLFESSTANIHKIFLASVVALCLGLITSVLFALMLGRALSFPIKRLTLGTHELAKGNFAYQLDVYKDDEIGQLALSFNQMAEKLQRTMVSKKYLDDLLNSIVDSIIVFDLTGAIVKANEFTISFLGYNSMNEFCRISSDNIFSNASGDKYTISTLIEKERIINSETSFSRKDGGIIPVLFSSSLLRDQQGETIGVVCVAKADTERKAFEEKNRHIALELEQSRKMVSIGTLAGGIAHEFNNILGSMLGYAELAQEGVPDGSVAKADLDNVLKAGKRAADLVKQILTFSHKGDGELKPIKIHHVIKEATKLLQSTTPPAVQVSQNICTDCKSVLADPTMIHQLLINLYTNAVQAMKGKGHLEISLREIIHNDETGPLKLHPGEYVKLTISDNGPGIEEAIKYQIFDPFFTTKEVGQGTGMGLSVVHGIVQRFGGLITVESEPGKGASFHVYFPAVHAEPEHFEENRGPILTGNEHILYVDDEIMLAHMGKQLLEKLGYKVSVRTSSVEALEAFRAQPEKYDLIVTDQLMPNINGDEFAESVLEIRHDIPIILCTGYSSAITKDRAREIGIRGFIMKPVDKRVLANTIRQVLDG